MKSGRSTFPIADSTTQGSSSGKLHTMAATSLIRSASATDEPPNFMTTVTCIKVSQFISFYFVADMEPLGLQVSVRVYEDIAPSFVGTISGDCAYVA